MCWCDAENTDCKFICKKEKKMKKVIILKGLPGSGKSFYAKELVNGHTNQYKRVNKDDLRAMLDDSKWSRGNEKFILTLRDTIIRQALDDGKHVIVDDTNLAPIHEKTIRKIAGEFENTKVEVKFFDVPVEVCIDRDKKRENPVGETVILDMYNKYLRPSDKIMKYDPNLPNCVVFDCDGTLAESHNRNIFDWTKVGQDKVHLDVADIINRYKRDHAVLIVSGRDGACYDLTHKWLTDNKIHFDELFLRPAGDTRKDCIIKEEIYREEIEGKYNVVGWWDDRNQVVNHMRSLGLRVYQVANGDF